MSDYNSWQDTRDHQTAVYRRMTAIVNKLTYRANIHDDSKLESPEKEIFDKVTPKLRTLTYGSDEYKAGIAELGEALTHHYANNSHHPEHYTNGVNGMSLLDVVEMFCDWKAASERHADGDFTKSLEINRKRFEVSGQLAEIFENTRREMGW